MHDVGREQARDEFRDKLICMELLARKHVYNVTGYCKSITMIERMT